MKGYSLNRKKFVWNEDRKRAICAIHSFTKKPHFNCYEVWDKDDFNTYTHQGTKDFKAAMEWMNGIDAVMPPMPPPEIYVEVKEAVQ
jgi:hypothetical protein